MATRTIRVKHQDEVRAKIQASQLVNVLQNHALGLKKGEELSMTRMKAIEILLRKSIPDLSSVEMNANVTTHEAVIDDLA